MNRIQQAIMKKYDLKVRERFYILYNKTFDGYDKGARVSNHKYYFDETGEVVNQRGQRKMSILGGLVAERFTVEKVKPFKLKQWEYDLLEFCGDGTRFESWRTLMCLKEKGHFKGIENTGMRISYILKNCEVVD